MYGVPDLPLSGSTRDESTEVDHTMYNAFNKIICVCYVNSSSTPIYNEWLLLLPRPCGSAHVHANYISLCMASPLSF